MTTTTANTASALTCVAELRQALGPGYAFAGPSDQLLRAVTCPRWARASSPVAIDD